MPGEYTTDYKSLEERIGTDGKHNVSKSGKATIRSSNKEISLDKAEVVSFDKDDMTIRVNGEDVKVSDIDFADEGQSYLFSAVSKIENITPGDATVIIRDYDPSSGISVGEYLNGVDEAYTYGYHGYSEADLKAGRFAPKLSDKLAMSAYQLGRAAKKNSTNTDETARKRMRTAEEAEYEETEIDDGAVLTETGEKVKVKSIASKDGSKMTLELESGEIVAADKVTFSEGMALIYKAISEMDISAKEANRLLQGYDGSITAEAYANGIYEAYHYGRMGVAYNKIDSKGYAEAIPVQVRKYAYQMGRKALETKGTDSYNSTTSEKERVNSGTGENVHIRRGSQRTDGESSDRSVRRVAETPGGVQKRNEAGRSESNRADHQENEGRLNASDLGIQGGTGPRNLSAVQSDYSADTKEAAATAAEQGLEAVFFTGNNLLIEQNGEVIEARACIVGKKIYIRADHPHFTATQLTKHELTHDKIDRGMIDPQNVYDMMVAYYKSEAKVKDIIKAYAEAYDMGYDTQDAADAVFVEIVCDSEAGMNYFSMEEKAGTPNFIENVHYATQIEMNSKKTRGPPADRATHFSRETERFLRNFTGKVRYDDYLYLSNVEVATICSNIKSRATSLSKTAVDGLVWAHSMNKEYAYTFLCNPDYSVTVTDVLDAESDIAIINRITERMINHARAGTRVQRNSSLNGQQRNGNQSSNNSGGTHAQASQGQSAKGLVSQPSQSNRQGSVGTGTQNRTNGGTDQTRDAQKVKFSREFIQAQITENDFTEALENGTYEHSKTFDSWTSHFQRGKGRYSWDSIRNGNRGATVRSDGMDGGKRRGKNARNSKESSTVDQKVKFSREFIQAQITEEEAHLQRVNKALEKDNASKIAELATKRALGQRLTRSEKSILANSEYGARVANELVPDNIMSGEYTTEWAEGIGTKQVNAEVYNIKNILEQMANMENASTYKSLEERIGTDGKHNVSKTGKATIRSSNKEISLDKAEVVSFDKDDMTIKVDGEDVKVSDIDFADEGQSYLFSALRKIENITPGDATVIIRDYDPASGLTAGEYLNGVDEAYTYGYNRYSEADLKAGQFAPKLSDKLAMSAYQLGRTAKKNSVNTDETARKRMRTANDVTEGKKTVKDKAATNGKTGRKKGIVKGAGVAIADLKRTFNDTQGKAYKYLSAVAKVTGIDIVLYRSKPNADGKFVAAQGRYSRSEPGTIYIDLNAGLADIKSADDLAKYAMLRTFAHEFTHFIENWNPIQYNEFRKVVFDTLAARGEDVDALIADKQARNPGMNTEQASREVVAEAMTDILPDTNFVQNLAENHKNIFQKLLAQLKEFVDNLRDYFNSIGHNPSREANALKEQVGDTIKYLDSIVKLFDNVAVQAVENFQAETAKNQTSEQLGIVQEQSREYLEEHIPITADMTDAERYAVLKDRTISVTAKTQTEKLHSIEEKIGQKAEDAILLTETDRKKLFTKIGEEFGVFKEYANADVKLTFNFSRGNLKESVGKQRKNYSDFAKMLSCFDEIIDAAIGIEIHNRNSEGYKPDPTLKNVYVLVSAFEDGSNIIPVKLEIKEFADKDNTLYVAIALESIKKDEVVKQGNTKNGVTQNSRSSIIRIADLFSKINPTDTSFLKYVPTQFLLKADKAEQNQQRANAQMDREELALDSTAEDDAQYQSREYLEGWDSYELDPEFTREVNYEDRHLFLRCLANQMSDIAGGGSKYITIVSGSTAYFFHVTGYMNGRIDRKIKITDKNQARLSALRKEHSNGTDTDREAFSAWAKDIWSLGGRDGKHRSTVGNRGTTVRNDALDVEESGSNTFGSDWESLGYNSWDELREAVESGAMVMDDNGNLITFEQFQQRTNTLTDRDILAIAEEQGITEVLSDGQMSALQIFNKKNAEIRDKGTVCVNPKAK